MLKCQIIGWGNGVFGGKHRRNPETLLSLQFHLLQAGWNKLWEKRALWDTGSNQSCGQWEKTRATAAALGQDRLFSTKLPFLSGWCWASFSFYVLDFATDLGVTSGMWLLPAFFCPSWAKVGLRCLCGWGTAFLLCLCRSSSLYLSLSFYLQALRTWNLYKWVVSVDSLHPGKIKRGNARCSCERWEPHGLLNLPACGTNVSNHSLRLCKIIES